MISRFNVLCVGEYNFFQNPFIWINCVKTQNFRYLFLNGMSKTEEFVVYSILYHMFLNNKFISRKANKLATRGYHVLFFYSNYTRFGMIHHDFV